VIPNDPPLVVYLNRCIENSRKQRSMIGHDPVNQISPNNLVPMLLFADTSSNSQS